MTRTRRTHVLGYFGWPTKLQLAALNLANAARQRTLATRHSKTPFGISV